jgi:hypothetical protein
MPPLFWQPWPAGGFQDNRLVLHGQIAVFVGRGSANKSNINRKRLIQKKFLAFDFNNLDDSFMRDGRDLAAIQPGIYEGAKPDRGNDAYLFARNGPVKLADNALRQQITLDFVVFDQVDHVGRCQRVPTDQSFCKPFIAQMGAASLFIVSAGTGMYKGDIFRVSGLQEPLLNANRYFLGPPRQSLRAGGDGSAVLDQRGCFLSSYYF